MGVPARTFTQAYYHLYGHNASPFLPKTVIFSGIFCIPLPGTTKGLAPRRKALIFLGTSLPLPQLRREHDLPRLRALGPDGAVVSLGNAPGDGEPHTEAAVGGAGLIRPIEPVKELLCLPLGQRCTGIAAPQAAPVLPPSPPPTPPPTRRTPTRPPTATPPCISHWVPWRRWVQPPPWSWWSCGSRKKPDLFSLPSFINRTGSGSQGNRTLSCFLTPHLLAKAAGEPPILTGWRAVPDPRHPLGQSRSLGSPRM